MPSQPDVVFLDANVLFSPTLTDTLLTMADHGLYKPTWSEEVLDEVREAIREKRPDAPQEPIDRRFQAMRDAFPEATVSSYKSMEETLQYMERDTDDKHVLAAAIKGDAKTIVTDNAQDFPEEATKPYGIEVQTADQYLETMLQRHPKEMMAVLEDQSTKRTKPARSVQELLSEDLSKQVPRFTQAALEEREKGDQGRGEKGALTPSAWSPPQRRTAQELFESVSVEELLGRRQQQQEDLQQGE